MEKNNVLQIDIVGNRYHIDRTQENLIPVDKDLAIIPTGELDVAIDHEWERSGYYDLLNKCLYYPPENLRMLPDHVIGFAIPSYQDISEAMNTTLVIYAETAALTDTDLAVTVEENKMEAEIKGLGDPPDKGQPASEYEMAGIEVDDEVCFFLDFVKLHLREYANPENVIPLSRMNDNGTSYEFTYDPRTRNIASSDGPENFKVIVDHLTIMHPAAVARIYHVPVEEVKKRNDKEFFRDLEKLRVEPSQHQKTAKKKLRVKRGKGI